MLLEKQSANTMRLGRQNNATKIVRDHKIHGQYEEFCDLYPIMIAPIMAAIPTPYAKYLSVQRVAKEKLSFILIIFELAIKKTLTNSISSPITYMT